MISKIKSIIDLKEETIKDKNRFLGEQKITNMILQKIQSWIK